jgi:hypothetical protein
VASRIGTPLAPLRVAWGWFAIGLGVTVVLAWSAAEDHIPWKAPGIFSVVALFILIEPRLRKREYETVQVDDDGVLRLEKDVREQVRWESVNEIRIITTNEGPLVEDVFFVLVGADATGCVVPHRAAVRTKLLEALQQRFPNLDDKMIITAMGCTGNNSFLIWERPESGAPIVAGP